MFDISLGESALARVFWKPFLASQRLGCSSAYLQSAVSKKKCPPALAVSCEKGINKQGCPLLERSGYDVFVFSMIACQQIKHYEPGLQQRRACSEDREGTVSQTLSWRFLFNAIRFPLSFFSASVSFFNYFFGGFFSLSLSRVPCISLKT